jgi:hypothetical protein
MKNWISFVAGAVASGITILVMMKSKKTDQNNSSSSEKREERLTDRKLNRYIPKEEMNEEIERLVNFRKYEGHGAPAFYTGVDLIAWNDSQATMTWGIRKESLMEELKSDIGGVFYTLKVGPFEQDSYLDALFEMCRKNNVVGIKFSLSRYDNKKFYKISFDSIKDLKMMKGIRFRDFWYDDVEVIKGD